MTHTPITTEGEIDLSNRDLVYLEVDESNVVMKFSDNTILIIGLEDDWGVTVLRMLDKNEIIRYYGPKELLERGLITLADYEAYEAEQKNRANEKVATREAAERAEYERLKRKYEGG